MSVVRGRLPARSVPLAPVGEGERWTCRYCPGCHDARVVSRDGDGRATVFLYRLARRTGKLRVEPYVGREDGEKVYLDPLGMPVPVPGGDLASGTCERCDEGMPADEIVRYGAKASASRARRKRKTGL